MRTFYIALAVFVLGVAWLLNKPIPKKQQVARAFSDAEIEYLEKSFDYAMGSLDAGSYSDWSANGVNGRISVGKTYTSPRNATCRPYAEVLRTHTAQKVDQGVACKRSSKDGWCRIHGENPQSCALEAQESLLKKRSRFAILQGTQMVDEAVSDMMGLKPSRMLPSMPSVSAPGMPSVGTIDIPDAPDIEPGDFRPPMPWDKGQ